MLDTVEHAQPTAINLNLIKTAKEGSLFIVKNGELIPAEKPKKYHLAVVIPQETADSDTPRKVRKSSGIFLNSDEKPRFNSQEEKTVFKRLSGEWSTRADSEMGGRADNQAGQNERMFLDESEYKEGELSVSDQINAIVTRNFDKLYSFDQSSSSTEDSNDSDDSDESQEFVTIEL